MIMETTHALGARVRRRAHNPELTGSNPVCMSLFLRKREKDVITAHRSKSANSYRLRNL